MDIECPHHTSPIYSDTWVTKEPTLTGADVRDGFLPPSMPPLPSPVLPLEDQEPSPLHASDWIEWHVRHFQKPSWWEELSKVPSHADHQEFAQKVHTYFEVPKAYNWVEEVINYYVPLLAHPSIGKHCFLPPKDMRFSTQDICLSQLHHTIAYARALQHWAEEVHPPVPGQAHHLARSVQELWWAMEPLIYFKEGEVFVTTVPSNCTEVTSPQLKNWQLHHGSLWHTSPCLTHGPCVCHPGLQKSPRPCTRKSPWRAACCQSSLAFQPKRQ